nr:hypothetical protein [uncultured Psychroserpens sp.]
MSTLDEKLKEYQSKKKKTSRNGSVLLIIGLIVFASLFLYNIYTKKEKQEVVDQTSAYIIIEKEAQIARDSIEYIEKKKIEDSVNQIVKEVQAKVNTLNNSPNLNGNTKEKIELIQVQLNTIKSISNRVIVRYYKRRADGNRVEQAIKSIESPNFHLDLHDVVNDDGKRKTNALYYGKNVNINDVKLLVKRLKDNNINIEYLKIFPNSRSKNNQDALELGHEKPTSVADTNNEFYVRIYGYNTNEKIKYAFKDKLEAKGYGVDIYPDWQEKKSFFSNTSTVLYYDSSNKEQALAIAKLLTRIEISMSKTKIPIYDVKLGAGYGVGKEEKKELFIIHYKGQK